jgi:threonine/homoserine/homoserine lactone efflux protein
MSLLDAVLSFAVVAGLMTLVPGLDTALVLRAAITRDRWHGFAAALGINTGALVWGAAAVVGISALLTASSTAYTLLRIVGAGYMVFLGGKMLWAAFRRDWSDPGGAVPDDSTARTTPWRFWWQGVLTNLLNPKIGAFYLAVLPQFIPHDTPHLLAGLLLALVHDIEGLIWFSCLILAVQSAHRWLAQQRVRRATDGVTGTVLVGFGLELGLSTR